MVIKRGRMHENRKLFDESGALCLKNNFKSVLIPKTTLKTDFKTNFRIFRFFRPPRGPIWGPMGQTAPWERSSHVGSKIYKKPSQTPPQDARAS